MFQLINLHSPARGHVRFPVILAPQAFSEKRAEISKLSGALHFLPRNDDSTAAASTPPLHICFMAPIDARHARINRSWPTNDIVEMCSFRSPSARRRVVARVER
jgi:hypothetical protein